MEENIMDVVESTKMEQKNVENVVALNSNNIPTFTAPRQTRTIIRKYNKKIGRNDMCPCGSGKKYKKCCMDSGDYNEHIELNKEEMFNIKNYNANPNTYKINI